MSVNVPHGELIGCFTWNLLVVRA